MTPFQPGRRRLVAAGAAVLLSTALPALPARALPVKHAKGTTEVPDHPSRIAVFDLATLDTLRVLQVPVAGVPEGKFPGKLAMYQDARYARLGPASEPDLAAIRALAPQLIVVGGRSAARYDTLAQLAPTLDLSPGRDDLVGSVAAHAELLGRLTGRAAQAAQQALALRAAVTQLQALAANAGTGLVLLTTGGKLSAQPPGTRFGVIHQAFGIRPAIATLTEEGARGLPVTPEDIRKVDPDWLLVIDRDAAIGREGPGARELLDVAPMHGAKAWQRGQVVYLDPANWYLLGGAGLGAMQDNVRQLARAFGKAS
ncbi:iron ABC transporter substrate-binding protein [Cupriavidus sp. TA19]|uniref:siderophore ABC transporter substrate-binding protein n=1 Tax=unclassified Cupriavidus TaxID=2640874 RepID=UPI000E2EFA31|nr:MULTISPECIES: siderophore ABC transporter substrate-binding protein [unclassified Cupriavidus]BDB28140.1 siderophore ABC transporter substrate-binding protein [Cupriavidus sp. P-10]GLC94224.1 iron ABC transporter substrate-binding protein [Cupriavidus sp. TA19]